MCECMCVCLSVCVCVCMHLWMDECMYVNSIPMYVCFMIIILINVNSIPGEREPRNII